MATGITPGNTRRDNLRGDSQNDWQERILIKMKAET